MTLSSPAATIASLTKALAQLKSGDPVVLQVERESPEAAAARIEHAVDRYLGRSSGRITPAPPPSDAELLPQVASMAVGRA